MPGETPKLQPARFQIHLDEQAQIIEEGRYDGCNYDGLIRNPQKFRHNEGCRAHHRGGDLAACGRGGFYRTGKDRGVADPFHQRNGDCPGRGDIRDRAAGQGREHGAGDYRRFGGPASLVAGYRGGEVDKELTTTYTEQKFSEQDEREDGGGRYPQRQPVEKIVPEIRRSLTTPRR